MPIFTAPDGTALAYHVRGEGEPLVVLPGGPMRASEYLGDLGGLAAHRRLILLDLRGTGGSATPADPATYRCDRQVEDVEALRAHLGLERMDVLAHSAGGSLAMLHAARHPRRVNRLVLVTAIPWALGRPATPQERLAAARLRAAEPWFATAFPAFEAWVTGAAGEDIDSETVDAFFYGRWDDTARAHAAAADQQTNDDAGDRFHDPAAYRPARPAGRPGPRRHPGAGARRRGGRRTPPRTGPARRRRLPARRVRRAAGSRPLPVAGRPAVVHRPHRGLPHRDRHRPAPAADGRIGRAPRPHPSAATATSRAHR